MNERTCERKWFGKVCESCRMLEDHVNLHDIFSTCRLRDVITIVFIQQSTYHSLNFKTTKLCWLKDTKISSAQTIENILR